MLTRRWPALCAWGAGLIHIAVAAGAAPAWAVLLGAIGAAELAWGVLDLRADRMRRQGAVLGASLAAIGLSAAAGIAGVMAWLPLAAAVVLLLVIAGAAALGLRRASRQPASSRRTTYVEAPAGPGRTIAGLLLGAALVSGLTTPALAMTDAGERAVPHGEAPEHGGH